MKFRYFTQCNSQDILRQIVKLITRHSKYIGNHTQISELLILGTTYNTHSIIAMMHHFETGNHRCPLFTKMPQNDIFCSNSGYTIQSFIKPIRLMYFEN